MSDISFYDKAVKPHLQSAQEYAYRCAREISRMHERPAFFTLAQDELDHAEREATQLLKTISDAKRAYMDKQMEQSNG